MSAPPPAWALALLREARVGRLATADAAAHPLAVPVCFAWDGEAIYSIVDDKPKRTRELRRLRHVAANPHVSLVVDEWDEDWRRLRWVIVEGRADIVTGGPALARVLQLLRAKYPQYARMDPDHPPGPALRVVPDRILAWRAAPG